MNIGIIQDLRAEGLSREISIPVPGWFGAGTLLLAEETEIILSI